MAGNHNEIEKRLWDAADELRANSKLRASEYSTPVLGLIFLRYADHKFTVAERELNLKKSTGSRRSIGKTDYQAKGVMFLPEKARYYYLLSRPEGSYIGKAINDAMKAIEEENEDLKGILPKTYSAFDNSLLVTLLKTFAEIPMDIEGDVFGKIYEYFLGEFAKTEGAHGGEFFTPTSIVRLIVEIIEPYHGRMFDPASGSAGMFVQSARFVERHKGNPSDEISIFGQEKTGETVRLAKMNLAVHGLSGDIREGNTYYEDIHASPGKFDFVMANPPFNVDRIDKDRLVKDPRFPFGLPRTDNGNYIWIQIFYSALKATGRAGFVMANSASDARSFEQDIRQQIIESHAVDVMVAVGPNLFYTVTLPCTLWFFDKGKPSTPRKDTVLFIDARHIYRQIDRAHRDWTPAQISFIANIVRLYRGEKPDFTLGDGETEEKLKEVFGEAHASSRVVDRAPAVNPKRSAGARNAAPEAGALPVQYRDVAGLCKAATLKEIEAQGWSLNPGRYVGVAPDAEVSDEDFKDQFETLNEELETLNEQARGLESTIAKNAAEILET